MVVLHQPAWETMASFMISQNNNIPRIRPACPRCAAGSERRLPPWTVRSITHSGAGGRDRRAELAGGPGLSWDKYMAAMARAITGGGLDVPLVSAMDYTRAKAILKAIPGIGEKVANCILLYGHGGTWRRSRWTHGSVGCWIGSSRTVSPWNAMQVSAAWSSK